MLWYLLCFLVIIFGLCFLLSLATRAKNEKLRKNGIPVFLAQPLWYKFLMNFLPSNQRFDRHVKAFHLIQGKNRLFDKDGISAVNIAGKVIVHMFKPDIIEQILNSPAIINKSWGYDLLKPWLGNGLLIRIENLFTNRLIQPWLWPDILFWLSPTGREFRKALRIVHNFTRKVISERKKEVQEQLLNGEDEMDRSIDPENIYLQMKKRRAFLDLLLYHHLTYGNISEEGIREEVDTFMFEGHDTTAVGVSWALYNIGLYPNVQKKVHEEIDAIFGSDMGRTVTVDDLKELRYTECVLKESLRLYPSVPFIGREHKEDTNIGDIRIPKGSVLSLDIVSIHRDPELFPNPEVFDPERFFPENSAGRKAFAYVPFSAGPRNCIGQRFAMMEEKVIVANLMRYFDVTSLDPPDKVIDCGQMVLRPLSGIRLKFSNRRTDESSK